MFSRPMVRGRGTPLLQAPSVGSLVGRARVGVLSIKSGRSAARADWSRPVLSSRGGCAGCYPRPGRERAGGVVQRTPAAQPTKPAPFPGASRLEDGLIDHGAAPNSAPQELTGAGASRRPAPPSPVYTPLVPWGVVDGARGLFFRRVLGGRSEHDLVIGRLPSNEKTPGSLGRSSPSTAIERRSHSGGTRREGPSADEGLEVSKGCRDEPPRASLWCIVFSREGGGGARGEG